MVLVDRALNIIKDRGLEDYTFLNRGDEIANIHSALANAYKADLQGSRRADIGFKSSTDRFVEDLQYILHAVNDLTKSSFQDRIAEISSTSNEVGSPESEVEPMSTERISEPDDVTHTIDLEADTSTKTVKKNIISRVWDSTVGKILIGLGLVSGATSIGYKAIDSAMKSTPTAPAQSEPNIEQPYEQPVAESVPTTPEEIVEEYSLNEFNALTRESELIPDGNTFVYQDGELVAEISNSDYDKLSGLYTQRELSLSNTDTQPYSEPFIESSESTVNFEKLQDTIPSEIETIAPDVADAQELEIADIKKMQQGLQKAANRLEEARQASNVGGFRFEGLQEFSGIENMNSAELQQVLESGAELHSAFSSEQGAKDFLYHVASQSDGQLTSDEIDYIQGLKGEVQHITAAVEHAQKSVDESTAAFADAAETLNKSGFEDVKADDLVAIMDSHANSNAGGQGIDLMHNIQQELTSNLSAYEQQQLSSLAPNSVSNDSFAHASADGSIHGFTQNNYQAPLAGQRLAWQLETKMAQAGEALQTAGEKLGNLWENTAGQLSSEQWAVVGKVGGFAASAAFTAASMRRLSQQEETTRTQRVNFAGSMARTTLMGVGFANPMAMAAAGVVGGATKVWSLAQEETLQQLQSSKENLTAKRIDIHETKSTGVLSGLHNTFAKTSNSVKLGMTNAQLTVSQPLNASRQVTEAVATDAANKIATGVDSIHSMAPQDGALANFIVKKSTGTLQAVTDLGKETGGMFQRLGNFLTHNSAAKQQVIQSELSYANA